MPAPRPTWRNTLPTFDVSRYIRIARYGELFNIDTGAFAKSPGVFGNSLVSPFPSFIYYDNILVADNKSENARAN